MNSVRPNIVWLTVDSIRADHTSVHGYPRKTTENLRQIANSKDGDAFDNCISEGIWSLPVGTSILTGTYPAHHQTVAEGDVVPDDLRTLPSLLSDVGYKTYGVSGNPWFSEMTEMNRGFENFEYITKRNLAAAGFGPLFKFILRLRKHSAGYTLDTSAHCTDFLANSLVKKWIREQSGDDPFFIYAHTEGAHTPYYPPDGHHTQFTEELEKTAEEARDFAKHIGSNLHEYMAGGLEFSDDEHSSLVAMYDGMIHYLDSQIGEIFDLLMEKDARETIFIVTSDHGDHLGEMGILSHKLTVHDNLAHVPLVTHGLNVDRGDSLTQHIDLTKEVAVRAGCDHDQLQGHRLGDRENALIYRSGSYFQKTREIMSKYSGSFDFDRFNPSDVHALRTREHKLVKSDQGTELYRIPEESEDISNDEAEVQQDLSKRLEELLQDLTIDRSTSSGAEIGEKMKDHLSDLGYL